MNPGDTLTWEQFLAYCEQYGEKAIEFNATTDGAPEITVQQNGDILVEFPISKRFSKYPNPSTITTQ